MQQSPIEPSWYCGGELALTSPEHVIPRSLGGGLVIYVCGPCNDGANEKVDQPLVGLEDVRRARAQVGLRDPRTNEPATFSETLEAQYGIRLRATWSKGGIEARVIPIEIPRPGTIVSDVFVDPRDAEEHERKQAERSAKRGQTVGPPLSEERAELPEPRFREGENVVLIAQAGGRPVPGLGLAGGDRKDRAWLSVRRSARRRVAR